MNRKDKEIQKQSEIFCIIENAAVCRLGIFGEEYPYIVPLCFGYEDNALYFHSANKGKKIDLLKKNPKVCFEMDMDHEVKILSKTCAWGMRYQSVVGFGECEFLESDEEKRHGLDVIVRHYSPDVSSDYTDTALNHTAVFRVHIRSMSGKRSE
ncbi:MAG: pyridoxamine 5'-phosphate oxidase family protein [Desulfobacterales bacterium]